MRPLIVLLLVMAGLTFDRPLLAENPEAQARQGIVKIVNQMKALRFCKSAGCSFKEIQYTLTPDKKAKGYQALIKAKIERPSRTFDKGSYRLAYSTLGWQLMGGSEATDVNDTIYRQDRFETTSVYSSRAYTGAVADMSTGYKQLYFGVFNKGLERK